MSRPRAFVGSATDGRLFELHSGHSDLGQPYKMLMRTNPLAPAGADMDCAFDRIYITLGWNTTATVKVTVIVDGMVVASSLQSATFQVTRPVSGQVKRQVFRHVLRQQVRRYTQGLRGTWFSVQLEADVGMAGDLFVEQIDLDFQPLGPTKEFV